MDYVKKNAIQNKFWIECFVCVIFNCHGAMNAALYNGAFSVFRYNNRLVLSIPLKAKLLNIEISQTMININETFVKYVLFFAEWIIGSMVEVFSAFITKHINND